MRGSEIQAEEEEKLEQQEERKSEEVMGKINFN